MEVGQTKLFVEMYLLYLNSLIVTAAGGALSFCS